MNITSWLGARMPCLWPCFALAMQALTMPVYAAAQALAQGTQVTYTDATGRNWCATVAVTGEGAGAGAWAWLTIDADPRRIAKVPVVELVLGCRP